MGVPAQEGKKGKRMHLMHLNALETELQVEKGTVMLGRYGENWGDKTDEQG